VLPILSNPSLADLRTDAALVSAEFQALARGLSEEQLRWSPQPSEWSVAQCLEHLVLTSAVYRPRLLAALHVNGDARRDEQPVRPGVFGGWLIALAGPGAKHRLPCPRAIAPSPHPEDGALNRFVACQGQWIALIEGADGLDLNHITVESPVSRLLTLSLGEALALVTGHGRRHLEQARRIRGHASFPP
jgi:hypothetical protein